MRLLLIAAGTRLPRWVNDGYEEYASRLTADYRLELKEIALPHAAVRRRAVLSARRASACSPRSRRART